MSERALVVIPAYNEAETIEQLATLAGQYADVCVVDDGSTDATPEILARLDGVHVIRHTRNTHIAGAILDGMRHAETAGYAHVITMDAGMSHDPAAIPSFLARRDAGLVIGCREQRVDVPIHRRLLSRCGTALLNLVLERRFVPWGGAGLRDATSGYRMYSRAAVFLPLCEPLERRALL